jgi:hypothetical protein
MKTINIRGKDYITVNERLKEFRNNFKDYSLTTEIIELGQDNCTMKATITDDKGVVRATGFAREVIAKSPINKFAFVENCETSAIGRALGNFGIGIDTAICTADELLMKMAQETEQPKTRSEKAAETRAKNKATKEEVEAGARKAIEYISTKPDNSIEIYSDDYQKLEKMEHLLREWNSDMLNGFLEATRAKIKPDVIPY